MVEDATQQMTQDRMVVAESRLSNDPPLVVLIGSTGISCRWELRPRRDRIGPDRLRWTFGRGENMDFKFDSNKKRLSNYHFHIWATEDNPPTILVSDVSTNGTHLNNVRLLKKQNSVLVNGDVLSVGVGVEEDTVTMVVSIPSHPTSSATDNGIHQRYQLGELLGQGAFAQVRVAIERETGTKFAMKLIEKRKIVAGVSVEREIEILKTVQNPHIVCLHEFLEDERYYYLVMDYVAHGDLMDYVQKYSYIDEDTSREIIRQVLEGVAYVHAIGISHRDIKPENILIAECDPVKVKIADFGLAKFANAGTFLKTFCGTLSYLAPEVLACRLSGIDSGYSSLVDIWSVGCLAYVILTGYMPFNAQTQEELHKSVLHGDYLKEPLYQARISTECREFLSTLLEVDVGKRPSASEALKLPWLACKGTSISSPIDEMAKAASRETQGSPQFPSRFSDVPHLEPDSGGDSDQDSIHAKVHADEVASQMPAPNSLNGVRDFGLYASTGVPPGTWLVLATRPNSVPFKDVYVTCDSITVGRYASSEIDLVVNDSRVSRLHCKIQRIFKPEGYEIWLTDFSTNGCYINGVRSPARPCTTRISNQTVLALFADRDDNVSRYLGFDFRIIGPGFIPGPEKLVIRDIFPQDRELLRLLHGRKLPEMAQKRKAQVLGSNAKRIQSRDPSSHQSDKQMSSGSFL